MPRIDGVLETSLYVADPARSASFYRDLFGFEAVVTSERLIALAAGSRQLLLLF
jgi:catechol 2,3-dioxygenase-like lactoylglutathione lyase family enzyme